MSRYIALAVAIAWAIMAGAAVLQTHRLQAERLAHEQTRLEYQRYQSISQAQALEAAKRAQEETERRLAAQQEAIDEANERAAAAAADADRAAAAGGRLRERVAALAARSCPAADNSKPSGASAPTTSTGDLLADVFAEVERAGRAMAAEADRRGIAGATCEAAYDSLTR